MNWPITEISGKKIPAILREIPEPPKKLRLQGKLPDLEKNVFLTVVGSRKYSTYGREVCERLIAGLVGQLVVIVSGLALGIDSIAHRAALDARLPTVAFPGSGLDRKVLYPAAHRRLADEILAAGGALVSEYPDDFAATGYSFPQRNRLMAGISKATLIVEAGEKSGTLITARLALDYNRDVCAIPGPIFSAGSWGPNWLISQGATPITSAEDLIESLGLKPLAAEAQEMRLDDPTLSPEERCVLELLAREPLDRDSLIAALKLEVSAANILLSTLELKGLIKERSGEFRR